MDKQIHAVERDEVAKLLIILGTSEESCIYSRSETRFRLLPQDDMAKIETGVMTQTAE
jgi:hypothetical protein